jgi:hypothetical protein
MEKNICEIIQRLSLSKAQDRADNIDFSDLYLRPKHDAAVMKISVMAPSPIQIRNMEKLFELPNMEQNGNILTPMPKDGEDYAVQDHGFAARSSWA